MTRRDVFCQLHPAVSLAWLTAVVSLTMCVNHPVLQGVSLACALCWALCLTGWRAAGSGVWLLLPMLLLTAVLNPLFNHQGATILLWLPWGNPLTLESVLYGISAGVLLAAAVEWFVCLSRVLTADKLVYLFGRVIPALSLALSMTLRFVPAFRRQAAAIAGARQALGKGGGGILARAREGLAVLSALVSWSLENAVETADSMRARGYGLPGRTSYAIYRFDGRDAGILLLTGALTAAVIAGAAAGWLRWQYIPTVAGELLEPGTLCVCLCWLALCALPLILDGREALRWRSLRSET